MDSRSELFNNQTALLDIRHLGKIMDPTTVNRLIQLRHAEHVCFIHPARLLGVYNFSETGDLILTTQRILYVTGLFKKSVRWNVELDDISFVELFSRNQATGGVDLVLKNRPPMERRQGIVVDSRAFLEFWGIFGYMTFGLPRRLGHVNRSRALFDALVSLGIPGTENPKG